MAQTLSMEHVGSTASDRDNTTDAAAQPSAFAAGVTFLEKLWRVVLNHKYVIGAIVLLALLLGIGLTLTATKQYTSTARIDIARQEANVTNVESLRDDRTSSELSFYQTQYALLQARSLAERVARAMRLGDDAGFNAAFRLPTGDESGAISAEAKLSRAADVLQRHIGINPVRGSTLIDIQFTSPDPALSARVADMWVEQFIRANLDRRFSQSADARTYLEQRLGQMRQNLEKSERDLIAYASSRGIVSLGQSRDAQGRTLPERTLVTADLEAINTALAQAHAERIAAEAALRQTTDSNAIPNPTLAGLRQRRAEVAANLAKLQAQFEANYPTVVSARTELAAIDRSIAQEQGRASTSTRQAYESAREREERFAGDLARLKDQFTGQQRNSIQYAILLRDVDTNRQLYEGLLQRYKEIGVAGVGTNNVSIVDRARIPEGPSSPNLPVNVVISLLLGIAIAAGVVFVLEHIDQSLRDPSDVEQRLGLPLLGSIPRLQPGETIENEMLNKRSVTYEAYLAARTNLSFLTPQGAPPTFMISSSRPGEGKSTTAITLAHIFAEGGRSVVLLDADMRNSTMAGYLGLTAKRGLSNYLAGDEDIESILIDVPNHRFSAFPAGPTPPNAAELIDQARFGRLIARLRERFDHVIVDAPPLLGLADAPLLAREVEGVVFVIEANQGRLRAIAAALRRLQMSNAKLFGAVVTKLDDRNASYGYGYGYGYGYEYGSGRGRAGE